MTKNPFSYRKNMPKQRVGLFGGSFNPAHKGHLAMSRVALRDLGLDHVWWLVSPQNPLKDEADMAPFEERVASAKSLTVNDPAIVVSDFETQAGTHYTIETLRAITTLYPEIAFVWLMGSDNMMQIHLWQEWEIIFKLVPVAVFRRSRYGARYKKRDAGIDCTKSKAATRFASFKRPMSQARHLVQMMPPAWLILGNPLNLSSATDMRKKLKTT